MFKIKSINNIQSSGLERDHFEDENKESFGAKVLPFFRSFIEFYHLFDLRLSQNLIFNFILKVFRKS